MRIITRFRQLLTENTDLRLAIDKLEKKSDNHSKNIEVLFRYYDELIEKEEKPKMPRKLIGYKTKGKN